METENQGNYDRLSVAQEVTKVAVRTTAPDTRSALCPAVTVPCKEPGVVGEPRLKQVKTLAIKSQSVMNYQMV